MNWKKIVDILSYNISIMVYNERDETAQYLVFGEDLNEQKLDTLMEKSYEFKK